MALSTRFRCLAVDVPLRACCSGCGAYSQCSLFFLWREVGLLGRVRCGRLSSQTQHRASLQFYTVRMCARWRISAATPKESEGSRFQRHGSLKINAISGLQRSTGRMNAWSIKSIDSLHCRLAFNGPLPVSVQALSLHLRCRSEATS